MDTLYEVVSVPFSCLQIGFFFKLSLTSHLEAAYRLDSWDSLAFINASKKLSLVRALTDIV